ncbi:Fungal cellulose binding domain protein [Ceratobasidium sp. AG-Ba]|nr:Fungal cellulose binding domain protein [Ceratobasidium sp. AG-Ba]
MSAGHAITIISCIPAATTTKSTSSVPPSTPPPTQTLPTLSPTYTSCPTGVAAAILPRSSGPPIHALDGWAKNTWLQQSKTSSSAILGPADSKGWFLPLGGTIRLIQGACVSLYPSLNVQDAATSYKPLTFDVIPKTKSWTYAGGDSTLTLNGTNVFIACADGSLYFQTGKDFPAGNCTATRLTTRTDI